MIGWGECKYGQLTTAATTGGAYSLPVPIELPGVFVTHAACGFRHTLCRSGTHSGHASALREMTSTSPSSVSRFRAGVCFRMEQTRPAWLWRYECTHDTDRDHYREPRAM